MTVNHLPGRGNVPAAGRRPARPRAGQRSLAKSRLQRLTRRDRGRALEDQPLGRLVGLYFRHAECHRWLRDVDGWLRQNLGLPSPVTGERAKSIADFMRSCGTPERLALATAAWSRGWWHAMERVGFLRLGLTS